MLAIKHLSDMFEAKVDYTNELDEFLSACAQVMGRKVIMIDETKFEYEYDILKPKSKRNSYKQTDVLSVANALRCIIGDNAFMNIAEYYRRSYGNDNRLVKILLKTKECEFYADENCIKVPNTDLTRTLLLRGLNTRVVKKNCSVKRSIELGLLNQFQSIRMTTLVKLRNLTKDSHNIFENLNIKLYGLEDYITYILVKSIAKEDISYKVEVITQKSQLKSGIG